MYVDIFLDFFECSKRWKIKKNPERLKLLFISHLPPIKRYSSMRGVGGMQADVSKGVEKEKL